MFKIVTRSGDIIDEFVSYPEAADAAQWYYFQHGIGAFVIFED